MNLTPKLHSLDLATDETVSMAWEAFFMKAWELYDILQARRATNKQEQPEAVLALEQENEAV